MKTGSLLLEASTLKLIVPFPSLLAYCNWGTLPGRLRALLLILGKEILGFLWVYKVNYRTFPLFYSVSGYYYSCLGKREKGNCLPFHAADASTPSPAIGATLLSLDCSALYFILQN